MKIAIFGATGGTGLEVVKQALAQGQRVTAFIRNPSRLPIKDNRLRAVIGDVFDAECVAEAVADQEAVIVTLGNHGGRDRAVRTRGTANVIRAMEAHNVPRLVVVSAGGVGDSYRQAPLVLKALIKTVMKNTYLDHEQQEWAVRASTLEWVIVRPAMLIDGPVTGRFEDDQIAASLPEGKVSRADVANFVLQQLTDDRYLRHAVSIP